MNQQNSCRSRRKDLVRFVLQLSTRGILTQHPRMACLLHCSSCIQMHNVFLTLHFFTTLQKLPKESRQLFQRGPCFVCKSLLLPPVLHAETHATLRTQTIVLNIIISYGNTKAFPKDLDWIFIRYTEIRLDSKHTLVGNIRFMKARKNTRGNQHCKEFGVSVIVNSPTYSAQTFTVATTLSAALIWKRTHYIWCNCTWERTSASFLAETSVRSPRQLFIFIMYRHIFWIKVRKKTYI